MRICIVWSAVCIGDIAPTKIRPNARRGTTRSDTKVDRAWRWRRERAIKRGERKVQKVAKIENCILIMDYCGAVVDIAKTNAIAQQNRLLKTIFYQTKFRIQRSIIIKNKWMKKKLSISENFHRKEKEEKEEKESNRKVCTCAAIKFGFFYSLKIWIKVIHRKWASAPPMNLTI